MNGEGVKMPVLVVGRDKTGKSVAHCLRFAGHAVSYYDTEVMGIQELPETISQSLLVLVTAENKAEKIDWIAALQLRTDPTAVLAVNMESIALDELQKNARYPEQIIGLNWAYPADKTLFLEIISNATCNKDHAPSLQYLAENYWNKDPYVLYKGFSARARMFAAMAREAFYLVENDYASIESVDRACRNDAGYYLPFAGNFRYMDLMGPYAYGMVMKDLNPELSDKKMVAPFFKELLKKGGLGMESHMGFYNYNEGDIDRWNMLFDEFSGDIRTVMLKYPFEEKRSDREGAQ